MQIFEYPYVIITILVFGFIIAGAVGLYFSIRFVRTASETGEKIFSNVNKLAAMFIRAGKHKNNRSVIYICIDTDDMVRLFSETKVMRIMSEIRPCLLKFFCNEGGLISRYGDENFIAVNEWEADKLKEISENCKNEINKILSANEAMNIAYVNFGFYTTQSTQVSFNTAIARAKQACTMAASRKVLFVEWDNVKGKALEKKIKIENNIEKEIEDNRFFLEYQPIIEASSGRIIGAEVLARLNSRSDGVLSPGAFLSAVNSVGLNGKFDYYIFEKTCKWISNNRSKREKYVYTINFSRYTLCEREFSERITDIVSKYGLSSSCIAVEILEDRNLSAEEKNIMKENIHNLKSKGIMILLDDFGSGYTSFTDLDTFDISIVKIDKKITQRSTEQNGFILLKNIIKTAKDLGFTTLCEGIETEEHRKAAIEAGSDILQGYYFYRPMPVKKFEELSEISTDDTEVK